MEELKKSENNIKSENELKNIYCSNCGEKLSSNSKFCNFCGEPINITQSKKEKEDKYDMENIEYPERKAVFDGKIHKCPNCGEKLKAFDVKCPSCGFEIRDRNSANSVKEFSLKLENIESNREIKKAKSIFRQALTGTNNITKTDEQKINLIRSFSIPNNKEDIFEFIILAASNVDYQVYGMGDQGLINASERAVSEAWVAKLEQAYQKAKITFKDDSDFNEIKTLYEKTEKKLESKKKGKLKFLMWFVIGYIAFFMIIGLIIWIVPSTPEDEARQDHLEYVVKQIEDDIVAGKYDDARNKAYTLTFDEELDNDKHIYWEKKRKDILEQIAEISGENKSIDEVQEQKTTENRENDSLDNDSVIKQLKVKEYKYVEYGKAHMVFLINNQSDNTLRINTNFKFYDKGGNLISAKDRSSNAVEKGQDTIMYVITDEDYDKMEYDISVEKDDDYKPIIKQLEYKSNKGKEKEILTVTNNSQFTGQAIEGYGIFFKNGKVICVDHEYFSDNNGVLKSNKSLTKEFDCDISYDEVKFYFTGFGE